MPPTYPQRLRIEGLTLAAAGLAGGAWILATRRDATRRAVGTIGQLAVVGAALVHYGPRVTAHALTAARPLADEAAAGSGDPTPLWQVPIPSLALTYLLRGSRWRAGLRVAGASALLGLYETLGSARQVARAEQLEEHAYYRLPGSRLGRRTLLGYVDRPDPA